MANSKSTRSRKRKKAVPTAAPKAVPARQSRRFPEVKGKVMDAVAVEIDPQAQAIVILFQDNTALSLNLDPRLSVFPELLDRRDGNWRPTKRWPPLHSPSSFLKWL